MYAIFLNSNKDDERGFFVGLTIHRGEEYLDRYNGKQRIKPRLSLDESKAKLWKTEKAVIKYADTLASRVKTIEYIPQLTRPYKHNMKYQINVINMNTHKVIYTIYRYCYSDRQG